MKRKEGELLWELALALIALGGIVTLIEGIPKYVIGSLCGIAFVIMLVTWVIRFRDARFLIKASSPIVKINTLDARRRFQEGKQGYPMIDIELIFFSADEVRISRKATLKLDKGVESRLRKLGRLETEFDLQIKDEQNGKPFFTLHTGEAVEAFSSIPLQMAIPFTGEIDSELETICSELGGKCAIGWQELGHKISWCKLLKKYYEL